MCPTLILHSSPCLVRTVIFLSKDWKYIRLSAENEWLGAIWPFWRNLYLFSRPLLIIEDPVSGRKTSKEGSYCPLLRGLVLGTPVKLENTVNKLKCSAEYVHFITFYQRRILSLYFVLPTTAEENHMQETTKEGLTSLMSFPLIHRRNPSGTWLSNSSSFAETRLQ